MGKEGLAWQGKREGERERQCQSVVEKAEVEKVRDCRCDWVAWILRHVI